MPGTPNSGARLIDVMKTPAGRDIRTPMICCGIEIFIISISAPCRILLWFLWSMQRVPKLQTILFLSVANVYLLLPADCPADLQTNVLYVCVFLFARVLVGSNTGFAILCMGQKKRGAIGWKDETKRKLGNVSTQRGSFSVKIWKQQTHHASPSHTFVIPSGRSDVYASSIILKVKDKQHTKSVHSKYRYLSTTFIFTLHFIYFLRYGCTHTKHREDTLQNTVPK